MKTIQGRLVLTYLLLVSASLSLTGFFFLSWMERSLERRAEAQLNTQSRVMGHFMSMYTQHPDDLPESARWVMKEFPPLTRARVRIADEQGKILGDSLTSDPGGSLQPDALGQDRPLTWNEHPETGALIVHVTTPIRLEYPAPRTVGYVDISSRLSELDDTFAILRNRLFAALAVALCVSCLGAMLLARNLLLPIQQVRQTATKIAQGDLEQRVQTGSGLVELEELADTINYMAAQLQQRLGQLISERNRIRTLLASLPDPVLSLGAEREIVYLNPAAEKALELARQDAEGKHLGEVWPIEPDERLLSGAAAGPEAFELRLPPRIFRCYILPYRNEKDQRACVVVLRDMTDIRRLEDVRTLFLGSVSHELRTPLTIIKGFAATLIDMPELDPGLRKPLVTIDQEADRLTRLVNDLLDLTKMRSRKLTLELEPVRLEEVVSEAVEMLTVHAERQGVSLSAHLGGGLRPAPVPVDRDRLKQVIINLVDNAVKFTPKGGQVSVRTRLEGSEWQMEIEDTGPGIPPEELPHLFEHFFRSREVRKVGGTGLGLAIVREIVEMHRGRVWAESQVGVGTKITVALPAPSEVRGGPAPSAEPSC
ncbi:MAG: ATP-binding protein [Vulcanimicrobiota bacterium]